MRNSSTRRSGFLFRLAGAAAVAATALTPITPAAARAARAAPDNAVPVCKGVEGYAASFGGRRTFLWHPDVLMRLKAGRDSDPAIKAAYAGLIGKADIAMGRTLFTVADKLTIPPSGSRNDYLSIVPNYFPDPAKPNGPWIRGEGTNPDRMTNKFDIADLDRMSADVEILALAYYFSENPRYATRAASIVRTWFLDPKSRMNPNMNFAHTVPGRENGRPDGVFETQRVQRVIDAVGLIGPSGFFTADDGKGLEKWFSDYVDWLRNSTHGKGASIQRNINAMWYDSQITHFALYARRTDVVKSVVQDFSKRRLPVHFGADGSMALEATRSRSLFFSIASLGAAYNVAEIASCVDIDLWNLEEGGRGIRKSSDFIAKYHGNTASWPFPESDRNRTDIDDLMYRANRVWGAAYTPNPRVELARYFKM
ncbi:alginate lyase family protein [Sphingomonas sp. G-3-2-10]|uniref:alginate lyase family protein n=1 Tax=Sphingomonas sp. G-3-2-10 TaxID=2728838 RepID=UPI00146F58BC|nr:alginate lyase family protein [Sphingomonas sp. G-3-2-10]NML07805.1 alginate lyase family protein [Sphingomonas sp. G-3-2-10]